MKNLLKLIIVVVAAVSVFEMAAMAASVTFHLDSNEPTEGYLKIYGTINCEIIHPALFDGTVQHCVPVTVEIPDWANDLMVKFDWTHWCDNEDHTKEAPSWWNGHEWVLDDLEYWIDKNLTDGPIDLAVIGDKTGVIQDVCDVIDLNKWIAVKPGLKYSYTIVNGECADLPGYLIGTSPIIFDPNADPNGNPFSTTRLTGTLTRHATLTLTPTPKVPTISQWGLIVMAGLLVIAGAVVIVRRRQHVTA